MDTATMAEAPTAANLKKSSIYIIVDPDTKDETPNPHFIESAHIKTITDWVRGGGVLVLLGNDVGNAELEHLSELAGKFGIQFNKDSRNKVPGNDFKMGLVTVPAKNPIFPTARRLYLKEISTLALKLPAQASIEDKKDVIMATSRLGKGTVFALGDPWLYNEYVDGRKLPKEYQNYLAAKELSRWLIAQAKR
jgi:unsaturated rhamnogalacturonyl hydrolase